MKQKNRNKPACTFAELGDLMDEYSKTCTYLLDLWAAANDQSYKAQQQGNDSHVVLACAADQMAQGISALQAEMDRIYQACL